MYDRSSITLHQDVHALETLQAMRFGERCMQVLQTSQVPCAVVWHAWHDLLLGVELKRVHTDRARDRVCRVRVRVRLKYISPITLSHKHWWVLWAY